MPTGRGECDREPPVGHGALLRQQGPWQRQVRHLLQSLAYSDFATWEFHRNATAAVAKPKNPVRDAVKELGFKGLWRGLGTRCAMVGTLSAGMFLVRLRDLRFCSHCAFWFRFLCAL